jgi:hypothetical protein
MNAAIPARRPATEEISGLIERVTFHNDDSGFCVLRVKARGQREEKVPFCRDGESKPGATDVFRGSLPKSLS